MIKQLLLLLILNSFANGQNDNSNANELEQTTKIPQVPGLLLKMLQTAGFKAEIPVRQVPLNFQLNQIEIRNFSEMTNMTEFNQFLTPILIPRIVGTENHTKVEEFIKNTLKQLNFNVELDEFVDDTPLGKKSFRNIIGTYDTNAEKRLLLACHYDSKILEGEVFLGATDSAAPCSIILDIASKLAPLLKKQQNPSLTLQLVFFDGEEAFGNWTETDSLYGSRHLAKKWSQTKWGSKTELERINSFWLLDLLGAKDPNIIAHQIGHGTKHLFNKIVEIEKHLNETSQLRKANKIFNSFEITGPIGDDHQPFRDLRVPIMHLISFEFPSTWHTADDNEKSLDMDKIYNLLTVLRVFTAGYLGLRP